MRKTVHDLYLKEFDLLEVLHNTATCSASAIRIME